MGVRTLALGLLVLFAFGCRKPEPVLQAGETLVLADEAENTQAYVAKPPSNWHLDPEGAPDFLVEGGESRVTVLVQWEPSKDLLRRLEITDAEAIYQTLILPGLRQGGDRLKFGNFSGVIQEWTPSKVAEAFYGKQHISLTLQDGLSFIMISAQNNGSDVSKQEVIDFAKTIRRP